MGQIFYLLNVRSIHRPAWTRENLLGAAPGLLAIGACLGLQLLFTYVPFMNLLFGSEPLDGEAWMRCLAVGLSVFVLVELEKLVIRRRSGPNEAPAEGEVSHADSRASRAATSNPGSTRERRQEGAQ